MRRLIAGLFLAWACSAAHASTISPTYTYLTAVSSITTNIPTVSSSTTGGGLFTATQMDSPQLAGRTSVEIQDLDTAWNLWCLPNSTSVVVGQSREVLRNGGTWIINVVDTVYNNVYSTTAYTTTLTSNAVKIYCINDGTGTVRAAVSQAY